MKVSEMLVKIEFLRGLKQDIEEIRNRIKSLTTDDVNTLDDAVDAIDNYIDELLRKNVTM